MVCIISSRHILRIQPFKGKKEISNGDKCLILLNLRDTRVKEEVQGPPVQKGVQGPLAGILIVLAVAPTTLQTV